jgi:hypothetical protein
MGAGETDRQQRASPRSLAGLFLLSLATLLLELALTRVLSVSLWYHFGFLVISTALLGFGAAGVTVALSPKLRDAVPAERPAAWASLGFALAALGGFWLLQRIPFDPFGLLTDRRQLLLTPLAYLCLAAPFYAAGVGIAALLARGGRDVPRLYAADLCGAAAGCMALAWVMPQLGGSGSVVAAVALACAAAAVFAAGREARLAAVSTVLAIVFALLAPSADQLLPIAITPNKRAPGSPPLYSAWNTFSRIDVLETPARTGNPASRTIIIDKGTAATGMMDLRPSVEAILSKPEPSSTLNTSAVYVGKQRPSVLVIASGAGREVLEALFAGARNVVAVEVNPIITDIISRRMADFWGGLFSRPEVRLVTEEGRSFVRRSTERYDVIVSTHAISNAAVAAGALSLAENYLLTREAFEDYLDHLAPDGAMFMTRPEAQLPGSAACAIVWWCSGCRRAKARCDGFRASSVARRSSRASSCARDRSARTTSSRSSAVSGSGCLPRLASPTAGPRSSMLPAVRRSIPCTNSSSAPTCGRCTRRARPCWSPPPTTGRSSTSIRVSAACRSQRCARSFRSRSWAATLSRTSRWPKSRCSSCSCSRPSLRAC